MSNTVTKSGRAVNVTAMDSDFDFSADTGMGVSNLESIQFIPNASDDELIVRDGSATGPIIFQFKAIDGYDSAVKYFSGQKHNPYIKYSECSVASCTVIFLVSRGR